MTLAETDKRIKAGIIAALHARLLPWYRRNRRDLPWRRTREPYAVLVSELMLQQTRVATVIPYYERWMEALPGLDALARAKIDTVLRLWSGLGYYARARNLYKAARAVVSAHGGIIPSDPQSLQALPGIGRYTAGAVASIAFNRNAPILDGNMIRVLSRLFSIRENTTRAAARNHLWELAGEIIPDGQASDFNQAMMELGAIVCLPRDPHCGSCPVHSSCLAHRHGLEAILPILRKPKKVRAIQEYALLLRRGNLVLLEKRRGGQLMEGLFTFPRADSMREIRRRLPGIRPRLVGRVTHSVMDRRITVTAALAVLNGNGEGLSVSTSPRWMPIRGLDGLALPSADRRLAALIQ